MGSETYYVIFFDEDFVIKEAHKSKTYPTVKQIVYLLKLLEKSDLTDIENLRMDIINETQFKEMINEDMES